jgi:multidrug efflux system membrane fusion protein
VTRATTNAIRIGLAALSIIGGGFWLHSRDGSPSTSASAKGGGKDASGRVVPVQLAEAKRQDLPIWESGLGTVAAFQQVTVHTQVDGRLDKVLFTEGQAVKKGEVLAQVDPRPFAVALHSAAGALVRDKAQLEAAKQNYERTKGLFEQNLVAKQAVEQAQGSAGQFEGSVDVDKAAIESAQLQLDYAAIKAPLDGIVGVRQVDAGNIIHATDANGIVVITAVDPAAVFLTIPQDQLPAVAAALARGDVAVEIWNRDETQELGIGKVAVLDNQVNQATSTLRLKALVPNPARTLWPNAFVKGKILLETRKDALVIPRVALQQGPNNADFVYVVGADNTAEMRPVTVSLRTDLSVVVDKGLNPGEKVVTEGQNQLRPGSKVATAAPGGGAGAGGGSGGGGGSGHGSGDGSHGGHRGGAATP